MLDSEAVTKAIAIYQTAAMQLRPPPLTIHGHISTQSAATMIYLDTNRRKPTEWGVCQVSGTLTDD
jgi:hypothetical protein